jgi:hypothetical protein
MDKTDSAPISKTVGLFVCGASVSENRSLAPPQLTIK